MVTEKDFKKLLIDCIERDSHPDKNVIIELLKRSNLKFNKTNDYTQRKWDHYKEFIYIVLSANDVSKIKPYEEYIKRHIRTIYPQGDDYQFELFGIEFKPGILDESEDIEHEVCFDDIQNKVIDEIRGAKYTIWIAMAWFTNKVIFDELIKKKKEGVNIQIVLDDNDKNNELNFSAEFETYKINIISLYKNIMHEKFCVIDFQKVVHGTFNWTNAANFNKETIAVISDRKTALDFSDEFIKLKLYGMTKLKK